MTHIHHTLAEEFSDQLDKLHDLKLTNSYFVRLQTEYDKTNEEINKIEAQLENTSDQFLEDLKKNRLRLKDEIAAILAAF